MRASDRTCSSPRSRVSDPAKKNSGSYSCSYFFSGVPVRSCVECAALVGAFGVDVSWCVPIISWSRPQTRIVRKRVLPNTPARTSEHSNSSRRDKRGVTRFGLGATYLLSFCCLCPLRSRRIRAELIVARAAVLLDHGHVRSLPLTRLRPRARVGGFLLTHGVLETRCRSCSRRM